MPITPTLAPLIRISAHLPSKKAPSDADGSMQYPVLSSRGTLHEKRGGLACQIIASTFWSLTTQHQVGECTISCTVRTKCSLRCEEIAMGG